MSETNNSNEVVVSIKNLQKAFGDNVVLRDIDLDVHKGEVVVVLGPSGSGKSTMLRCINRLEHPTSGSIVVEGVDVCAKGVDLNKVRTHLGMVFQQFNLFPHMTAIGNVMEGLRTVRGMPKPSASANTLPPKPPPRRLPPNSPSAIFSPSPRAKTAAPSGTPATRSMSSGTPAI